jgi:hypothetical protein
MVKEAAYRKAVQSVSGTPAQLTPVQEARFAARLLPQSTRADALSARPAAASEQSQPQLQPAQASPGGSAVEQDEHPLSGVRFAALTAPGPTGTRAEHAKELLSCHNRRMANRLCRAMAGVQRKIRDGDLIAEAGWIKSTRLVLLAKKGSATPRPVRVGEFLRGAVAKRLQRQAAPRLRRTLRSYHQWGVAMPGGCEALVHWRSTVEELADSGAIEPLVAFDLDLKNMFGSIEWAEIRAAVDRDFQEAASWLRWQQSTVDEVDLPGGGSAYTNRGAGQGDVFGSTMSSLTLGGHVAVHRESWAQSRPQQPTGAADEWFIDDGQAFVKPQLADRWLQSVDLATRASAGAVPSGKSAKAWPACSARQSAQPSSKVGPAATSLLPAGCWMPR